MKTEDEKTAWGMVFLAALVGSATQMNNSNEALVQDAARIADLAVIEMKKRAIKLP